MMKGNVSGHCAPAAVAQTAQRSDSHEAVGVATEAGPSRRVGAPEQDPGPSRTSSGWSFRLGDFVISRNRVTLRKTGNFAELDWRLAREVAIWLTYTVMARALSMLARRKSRAPTIWFTPDVPHARYMIRAAAMRAGIGLARSEAEADAVFFFEDETVSTATVCSHPVIFNFRCTDISKSHVAAVFAQVFGYELAVDPRSWRGQAVEKGERNGAHDGRIVDCPCEPLAGKTYQRLVDTVREDGFAYDLRTHCVGSKPLIVWEKRRAPEDRFLPPNLAVTTMGPEEAFSADELTKISAFCDTMGADWCGLDVLRDRDGRIYVVDVNKTDTGPIIALPLSQKLKSTALLGAALLGLITARRPQGSL